MKKAGLMQVKAISFIIILLMDSSFIHTHVMDFSHREELAAFGVQVEPVGELFPYSDSWIHTFVIRNPVAADYDQFIQSLQSQCDFPVSEEDFNITVLETNASTTASALFHTRCQSFTSHIITLVRQIIDETFGSELPQPHDSRYASIDASILANSPIHLVGKQHRDLLDLSGRVLPGFRNETRTEDEVSLYQKLAAMEPEYATLLFDHFVSTRKPCPSISPLQVFYEQSGRNMSQTAKKAKLEISACKHHLASNYGTSSPARSTSGNNFLTSEYTTTVSRGLNRFEIAADMEPTEISTAPEEEDSSGTEKLLPVIPVKS
jgi:hypothetical protein